MSEIKANIKDFQTILSKAKELIKRVRMKNSAWINLGIEQNDVDNAEQILQDIQTQLALISNSVIELSSAAVPDEVKMALLNKGINITFSDLNTIYSDIKLIKKDMKSRGDQESNVKYLKSHFTLFENHCQKIKEQLKLTLAGK